MVEVIVASVLFAASAAGIFATVAMTNRDPDIDTKIQAARFAKKVIDGLNKEVIGSTWSTAGTSLAVGVHNWPADAEFSGYTATYTVSADVATGARKVVVNINWP